MKKGIIAIIISVLLFIVSSTIISLKIMGADFFTIFLLMPLLKGFFGVTIPVTLNIDLLIKYIVMNLGLSIIVGVMSYLLMYLITKK